MSISTCKPDVLALERPEGTVAYEVSGTGPLIVCAPGMGDLRSRADLVGPAITTFARGLNSALAGGI
jgi:hypothetical protein